MLVSPKNQILFILAVALLQFAPTSISLAQSSAPLFASEDVIAVSLHADWKALLRDRDEERDEHPATLRYQDANGDTVSLDVQLRVRGNFRRNPDHCVFPPLRLNLKKKAVEGTVFDGQDKLKLVTHCQQSDRTYEQRILLEYMAYKMYNQLSDASFRVRLLAVSYEGLNGKKPLRRYGFLIEDEDALASRLDGKIIEPDRVSIGGVNGDQLLELSMFQYMIANTDWSIPFLHNIKMVEPAAGGKLIPVPYDFDWSGLVDSPYATPAQNLPIKDVKDRLYRGYCQPDISYEPVIDTFNGKREEILSLLEEFDPLISGRRKYARRFVKQYYRIINNSKSVRRNISQQCRAT